MSFLRKLKETVRQPRGLKTEYQQETGEQTTLSEARRLKGECLARVAQVRKALGKESRRLQRLNRLAKDVVQAEEELETILPLSAASGSGERKKAEKGMQNVRSTAKTFHLKEKEMVKNCLNLVQIDLEDTQSEIKRRKLTKDMDLARLMRDVESSLRRVTLMSVDKVEEKDDTWLALAQAHYDIKTARQMVTGSANRTRLEKYLDLELEYAPVWKSWYPEPRH